MEPDETPGAEGREPGGEQPGREAHERASASQDALRRLEERLDRASDAAERLLAEAARASAASAGRLADAAAKAAGAAKPPPAGWQAPDGERGKRAQPDSEVLAQVIRSVRELVPPELQRRLAEALRELLLALRALIDWYLERAEQRRAEPAEVQDIPIL